MRYGWWVCGGKGEVLVCSYTVVLVMERLWDLVLGVCVED